MLTAVMSTVTAVDAASKKVKVTWDANDGKIGNSKIVTNTVTKNAKVGKLPKTPKKTGYAFKGWYTKKTTGTKITITTYVKKKVTYYAHWKKKGGNTATANKIVGRWRFINSYYNFDAKGNYALYYSVQTSFGLSSSMVTGKYSVSNDNIYLTNLVYFDGSDKTNRKDQQYKYSVGKDKDGEFLLTPQFNTVDNGPIFNPVKFRRVSYSGNK